MKLEKNAIWEAEILDVSGEGSGIAKLDGYTVFVPDTAKGDVCRIRLLKCNKSYGYGRVEELLTPSLDRIEVDCPVFAQCGGCTFRHISYEAELRLKEKFVQDAFERLGGIHAPVRGILGAENPDGYRNKAQYPLGYHRDGTLISGFYARRSHRIVDLDRCAEGCRLQPEVFGRIHREVLDFLREQAIPAYDETTGEGLVRHLYLRRGEVTGEIMVCLVAVSFEIPGSEMLVGRLLEKFPEICSIVINRNDRPGNVILGEACRTLYGKDTIRDVLCGVEVALSPRSFYQVNHSQAEILYQKAISYGGFTGRETLLDLYCGAGTIGLAAAGKVSRLIGVEIIPDAVKNARENAERNGIRNARFLCADAGEAAQTLAADGVRPDVIVVDPPRKGLDGDVLPAIVQMSPDRVVMVSCNPATAARDTALLTEQGYAVQEITPVDMFPRTGHVECVILLSKVRNG